MKLPLRKILPILALALAHPLIAAPAGVTFAEKLPPPAAGAADPTSIPPFEKQFQTDTGQTARTRRIEIVRPLEIPPGAKRTLTFQPDLSAWSAALRAGARMWIAIGAPAAMTNQGTLMLDFSQNGVGMETALNDTYAVGDTALLGVDYRVKDGPVTVTVENRTPLSNPGGVIHVIVYAPEKPAP